MSVPGTAAAALPTTIRAPAPVTWDASLPAAVRELEWKVAILASVLAIPRSSKARGAALATIAGERHYKPDGSAVTLSIRTLRRWLRVIEAADGNGSLPLKQPRADRGKRRHLVSRQWDSACPLPDSEKRRIAAEMEIYVRSLWAKGIPGAKIIGALASSKLVELSRAAGWNDACADNCKVTRHAIARESAARIIAIKERDAKRFADQFLPRIVRSREGLRPMDIVVGDVHPVDIIIARADGSTATPRCIGWLDLATNSVQYTLVLCDAGKGITQADIAAAFAAMTGTWGLPVRLHFDNGSEYKWAPMADGFAALTAITQSFHAMMGKLTEDVADLLAENVDEATRAAPVEGEYISAGAGVPNRWTIRSKPYNAAAKAIEGIFGVSTRYYSMLPGYIGGDRMAKKTHRVGVASKPYPGTWEQFQADFAAVMDLYHATPQRGSLQGLSPNQSMQRHIAQGWTTTPVSREVLMVALSETVTCKVYPSGIRVGGEWYESDALMLLRGARVAVRYAKWEPSKVLLIGGDGKPCAIPIAKRYHPLDRDGARESGRRIGVMNHLIRAMRDRTVAIDPVAEVRRNAKHLPPQPVLPQGAPVMLAGEQHAAVEALNCTLEAALVPRLGIGELRIEKSGEVLRMASPAPGSTGGAPRLPAITPPQRTKSGTAATVPDLMHSLNTGTTKRKAMP